MTNYPNTDYALDSEFKVDLINDTLASKEMYIGRHYAKSQKWIAAIMSTSFVGFMMLAFFD